MTSHQSRMRSEIEEIPHAVAHLLDRSRKDLDAVAAAVRADAPRLVATVARGSSDHAAAYLKYAIELSTGIPVVSLGPSVSSIYGAQLRLADTACVAISQSGEGPDVIEMSRTARQGGARTIALTNAASSTLAQACDHAVDIQAGPEHSVAATKTFVASVAAGLSFLARWRGDSTLADAVDRLPERLGHAIACDWSPLHGSLSGAASLYVLGRGPAMAIADEAALKFKETCQMHAEAYSSAEVMHGPVSIVGSGFVVLALAARDASEASIARVADGLADQGAEVFATTNRVSRATALPFTASGHPLTDPLLLAAAFYPFVEAHARRLGQDPDCPPHLRKVTETL